MKNISLILGAIALTAVALAIQPQSGGQTCCGGMMAMQHDQHQADKPVAAKLVKGVQKATITVDGGKYSPAAISVVNGKPVELTFKAGRNPGCGSTIVFKSLKISKEIEVGKPAVVKFTPKKSETIAFTCGMGMYDGKVVVK